MGFQVANPSSGSVVIPNLMQLLIDSAGIVDTSSSILMMTPDNESNLHPSSPNYVYTPPNSTFAEDVPKKETNYETDLTGTTNTGHIFAADGYHYRAATGFEYPVRYHL